MNAYTNSNSVGLPHRKLLDVKNLFSVPEFHKHFTSRFCNRSTRFTMLKQFLHSNDGESSHAPVVAASSV